MKYRWLSRCSAVALRRHNPRNLLYLIAAVFAAGCATPCHEESFALSFDAQRVVQLSHEAYRAAYDAEFTARDDLRTAAFRPNRLEREVFIFLHRLRISVPWIADDVEKYPGNPRCSSKGSYDIVSENLRMLKARYRPESFRPVTVGKIENLIRLLDEISSYYAVKRDHALEHGGQGRK